MPERIFFRSDGLELEALLETGSLSKAVVITHPHPLYGGDMHSSVVAAMAEAWAGRGWTTLRFNFRGVGRSHGSHDRGRGEQRDVAAAVAFVQAMDAVSEVALAGYSFGSWVNARAAALFPQPLPQVMVSPPVAFMDFGPPAEIAGLRLVVTGERDDIAPVEKIRALLPAWGREAALEVIAGADHFYGGRLADLQRVLAGCLGGSAHRH